LKYSLVTAVKITVVNIKNTFYIRYCKKAFLNPDFTTFVHSLTVLTLVIVVTWF